MVNFTFKHSGDLGDIIYSLPTMKSLGGGVLYLDVGGGVDDEYCKDQLRMIGGKTKFNLNSFNFLKPLLLNQPYIEDVKIYNGEKIDFNLNKFRKLYFDGIVRSKHNCLLDANRLSFNLPPYDVNIPWIDCGEPIKLNKNLIVSRSPRYQSAFAALQANKFVFQENAIFIGLKKEHELFEWTFGIKLDFFESGSALEIAKVIKGSDCIISNSTFNLSVALSIGHNNIVQEIDKVCQITLFPEKKGMRII